MSIATGERRAVCFFSTENKALDYAEYHVGGGPGSEWEPLGSEDANDLIRITEHAAQRGFKGWILDPPLSAPGTYVPSSWPQLRNEVERKIDVGAAWGSAPRSAP